MLGAAACALVIAGPVIIMKDGVIYKNSLE